MINFILEYWFIAAIVVAAWGFLKFTTYPTRRNVARVERGNNTIVRAGTPLSEPKRKEIIEKLINEMK